MKQGYNLLSLFSISLVCLSCIQTKDTAFSLSAEYFCNEPLKVKAVDYLANSASYHFGVPRYIADSLGNSTDRQFSNTFSTDSAFKQFLDSKGYVMQTGWAVRDVDTLSAEFIIRNVDLAFDSWQKPWAKDVSFEDFCKYILPYRNADESLSDWRWMLKQRYEPSILDSVANPESLKDVAEYVMREIRRDIHYSTCLRKFYGGKFLSPTELLKLGGLECRGCAHYATLALRACGIPCCMIELHWRFTEVPHTSVLIPAVGTNSRAFRINIGDTLIYMGEPKDTMAVWRAWAYSYTPNAKLLELANDESIPPAFSHPLTREDVTAAVSTTRNFAMPVPHELKEKKHLFLCRFSDWGWYAIREGDVKGDSVFFCNATIRQWYRLGYYDKKNVETFGDTFTLQSDGELLSLNNKGDSISFCIEYSYNPKHVQQVRNDTIYYWGANNEWKSECIPAFLWGNVKATGEEELYNCNRHTLYNAIFYRQTIRQPRWTVFYNNYIGRPVGFSCVGRDTSSVELMCY